MTEILNNILDLKLDTRQTDYSTFKKSTLFKIASTKHNLFSEIGFSNNGFTENENKPIKPIKSNIWDNDIKYLN